MNHTNHKVALISTAQAMVADGKGLLAMDESNTTCDERFQRVGIAPTLEMRRAYRELLLTTPGLSAYINGVILYDETIHQARADGMPFVQLAHDAGLMVGIKVDSGAQNFAGHPGEKVTEGLDDLPERLKAYSELGAKFTKWRGVIAIVDMQLPSRACIDANALALARYATLSQEAGLVPIIEPEVLMTGTHTLKRCREVTEVVLRCVFEQLAIQGVLLEAIILKPNMVIAGLNCAVQNNDEEVADATLECLRRVVPATVAGITFLSGGQSGKQASSRLNAIHILNRKNSLNSITSQIALSSGSALPWALSFSFARALQHPALNIWAGQEANRVAAQAALMQRARCNVLALKGEYSASMEF
jgi:fructose-bisphosphate aldolase, class I